MFNLPALPEIGLDSKTICDICMRKKSSEFYNCGLHKMCSDCQKRFSSLGSCPLCGKCNQRCIERMMGHYTPACLTYFPPVQSVAEDLSAPSVMEETPVAEHLSLSSVMEETPVAEHLSAPSMTEETPVANHFSTPSVMEEAPLAKEEEVGLQPCGSDHSLLNSISSIETVSDSDDPELCLRTPYYDACEDDPFASLDAEFNRNDCKNQKSCSGLCRCCYSMYDPSFKENCGPSTEKRKTLQKSKHMTSEEFQKMIDICRDM